MTDYRLISSDSHVTTPVEAWQEYLDPEFRDRAPRRLEERRWDIRTLVEGGERKVLAFPQDSA